MALSDMGLDGFCDLPLALLTEVLADNRLETGLDGEVVVFWAAVSWLETAPSRLRHAEEARYCSSSCG